MYGVRVVQVLSVSKYILDLIRVNWFRMSMTETKQTREDHYGGLWHLYKAISSLQCLRVLLVCVWSTLAEYRYVEVYMYSYNHISTM